MKATSIILDGVLLIEPDIYGDERGFFLEHFEKERYREHGITEDFVQDNHSRSAKNVLRGLHYTKTKPQSQILTVMRGIIFDVVVDIRKNSPTFGKWFGTELSDENIRQIYMPHGFAHGFSVLSQTAELLYKLTNFYHPEDEKGIRWDDPSLKIDWKIKNPIVSEKDQIKPFFEEAKKSFPQFVN